MRGFVDSVAADGGAFDINDATFLVDSATELEDGLVIDETLVGRLVDVEADIDPGGAFVAVEVEAKGRLDLGDVDGEIEIAGTLVSVDISVTPNVVVINRFEFEVDDASSLEPLVGQRVAITGTRDDDGVIILMSAEAAPRTPVRLRDLVETVDAEAGTLTTRLGIVIAPSAETRLKDRTTSMDDSDGDMEGSSEDGKGDRLSIAEFLAAAEPGDGVLAGGFDTGDGSIIWSRVRLRTTESQSCRLQGPVAEGSVSDPFFDILDVTVDTTGLEDDEFENEDDEDVGRTAFFADLMAGDVVKATSDEGGVGCVTSMLSTFADGEVELENNDGIFGNPRPDRRGDDDDDDFEIGESVSGVVSALDGEANTFMLGEVLVTVTPLTRIDDDIVEAARGEDIDDDDPLFGFLPETLDELLSDGDEVEVRLSPSGKAFKIELADDDDMDDMDAEDDDGEDGDG